MITLHCRNCGAPRKFLSGDRLDDTKWCPGCGINLPYCARIAYVNVWAPWAECRTVKTTADLPASELGTQLEDLFVYVAELEGIL